MGGTFLPFITSSLFATSHTYGILHYTYILPLVWQKVNSCLLFCLKMSKKQANAFWFILRVCLLYIILPGNFAEIFTR